MDPFDVTYAGAFLAGMLSFASPCVLPLVPAYLGFVGGLSYAELTENANAAARVRVLAAACAFVLGFATVFVALGATATTVSRALAAHMDVFAKIAGALIVVLGLHYAELIRIPFLQRDMRLDAPAARPAGLLGAYVVGLAFAFGWTPCVGPILAVILGLAATQNSVTKGIFLLAIYSLGLAVPFLLTSLGIGRFLKFYSRFRSHMHALEVASGALLIVLGGLLVLGRFTVIARYFSFLNRFAL